MRRADYTDEHAGTENADPRLLVVFMKTTGKPGIGDDQLEADQDKVIALQAADLVFQSICHSQVLMQSRQFAAGKRADFRDVGLGSTLIQLD